MSKSFPSINDLLESPQLKKMIDVVSRSTVVTGVGQFLDKFSGNVQSAMAAAKIPTPQELAQKIAEWIAAQQRTPLRATINATGVLLDPRAGGPPLSVDAVEAIRVMAAGYACVPHDPAEEGGSFSTIADDWLTRLTGAEAAFVTNRASSAVIAALAAAAANKEVLVSRGEVLAVEPEANLPQLIAAAGATLKEVGTTPATKLADFEGAITDRTAVILRVRTGLNASVGAVEQPSLTELAALAHRHSLVLIDINPGGIVDFTRYLITGETSVKSAVTAGADLVIFPGSDLLGGPVCGIIAGRQALVQKIKSHVLGTSVAADKLTLAGLAAMLPSYVDVDTAEQAIPLLTLLATSLENLRNRAERLAPQIASCSYIGSATAVEDKVYLRGARIAGQEVNSWCVELTAKNESVTMLARRLKSSSPAVLGRIVDGRLRIDLRSVPARDDMVIAQVFEKLSGDHKQTGAASSAAPEDVQTS
jgi:L-seryl-tRNA(Ser) seleniumtransferase